MGWFSVALIYIVVWWLVWQMTLPFGIRRNDSPAPLEDAGAPVRGHLKIKFMIATVIAALLTLIAVLVLNRAMEGR